MSSDSAVAAKLLRQAGLQGLAELVETEAPEPAQPPTPEKGKATAMLVTPQVAKEWLAKNTKNRTIRINVVRNYARDMRAGKWLLNGETIKLTKDGNILDGQHRLLACVEANSAFWTYIIKDLPPETQDTVDTGLRRQFKDVLHIAGTGNSTTLASSVRAYGQWLQRDRIPISSMGYSPTNAELQAILEANPGLADAVVASERLRHRLPIPPAVGAVCWYIFSRIDRDDADGFFEMVGTGDDMEGKGLDKEHPARALRETLVRMRLEPNVRGRTRFGRDDYMAVIIKAWNAFREGRPVKQLVWRRGGAHPEQFPEAV